MKRPAYPSVTSLQPIAEEAYCRNADSKIDRQRRRDYLTDCRPMRLAIRAIVSAVRAEIVKGTK